MLSLIYIRALLCSSPILQSKIQAQRHDETCPWSHNQEVVELGSRSSSVRIQSLQRLLCRVSYCRHLSYAYTDSHHHYLGGHACTNV